MKQLLEAKHEMKVARGGDPHDLASIGNLVNSPRTVWWRIATIGVVKGWYSDRHVAEPAAGFLSSDSQLYLSAILFGPPKYHARHHRNAIRCTPTSCCKSSRHCPRSKASGRCCAHVRTAISADLRRLQDRKYPRDRALLAIVSPLGVTKPARKREQPCCRNRRYSDTFQRRNADVVLAWKKAGTLAASSHGVPLSPSRARLQCTPGWLAFARMAREAGHMVCCKRGYPA